MKLFEPVTINGMTLANRVVLPAMVTRLSGEDGFVNEDIRQRYLRFARGEPGMIVIEAMSVHGGKSGPLLRLSSEEFIPGHADLARRMHDISPSKVVPQIIHFLKISRSGWRQKVADLSIQDIKLIVEQYGVRPQENRDLRRSSIPARSHSAWGNSASIGSPSRQGESSRTQSTSPASPSIPTPATRATAACLRRPIPTVRTAT